MLGYVSDIISAYYDYSLERDSFKAVSMRDFINEYSYYGSTCCFSVMGDNRHQDATQFPTIVDVIALSIIGKGFENQMPEAQQL